MGGEGDLPGRHAKELRHGVEEPDDGEFDGEVAEEDLLSAGPLFAGSRDLVRLQLPFAEVRCSVDDNPGNRSAEVYDLPCRYEQENHTLQYILQTSCSKKLARPVARTGFPSQIYHEAHCSSIQLSFEKSVVAYRALEW